MSDLRVLSDAELDVVGGGITSVYRSSCCGPCCGPSEAKLDERIIIIADILKNLFGGNCGGGLQRTKPAL
jgi:hypothetical protein